MDRIGVRELRQHASRYLARVKAGETIEVTDRGQPVALLVPAAGDHWQELIASGQVASAADAGGGDLPGALPGDLPGDVLEDAPFDYGIDASGLLAAMRADER